MSFQLRFSDATLDADLLDGSPGTLILEPTVRYALCRSMTVRPDGCMPLVVRDPKVSACHFTLSFLDGRWRVEDGNGTKPSTNGTLLDGEKIGSKLATLTPGSVLAAQGSKTSLYFEKAPVSRTRTRTGTLVPDLTRTLPTVVLRYEDDAGEVRPWVFRVQSSEFVLTLTLTPTRTKP